MAGFVPVPRPSIPAMDPAPTDISAGLVTGTDIDGVATPRAVSTRVQHLVDEALAMRAHTAGRADVASYLPASYVTDGSVDYSAQIQEAIDAMAALPTGGRVVFPSGRYAAVSLQGRSNVTLDLRGAELVKADDSASTVVLDFSGTVDEPGGALLSNVALGATSVSTSAPSVAVGDIVMVYDTTVINPAGGPGFQGRNQELNKVAGVSGNTVSLTNPTIGSYATASGAAIAKVTAVENPRVIGGKITIPVGMGGGAIYNDYSYGFESEGVEIQGMYQRAGIQFDRSAHFSVTGGHIHDGQGMAGGSDNGYALEFSESSHHGIVSNVRATNYTSIPFTNNARHIDLISPICRGSYDSAINTHGTGASHILISSPVIEGSRQHGIAVGYSGAPVGDHDITITNPQIVNVQKHGISVASAVDGGGATIDAQANVRINISGGSIRNFGIGVGDGIGMRAKKSKISGVVISGGNASATYAVQIVGSTDVLVEGVLGSDMPGGYGFFGQDSTRVVFNGNLATDIASTHFWTADNCAASRMVGNTSDDDAKVSIGTDTVEAANSWNP